MNIYYNPEVRTFYNQNHVHASKTESEINNLYQSKQNPASIKKSSMNHLSTPKSVGKFKRTNPSLHHAKTPSPIAQKVVQNYLNGSKMKQQTYKQPLSKDEKKSLTDLPTNLTTSRQTGRTVQHNPRLYISPSIENRMFLTDRHSPTREKYSPQNEDLKSMKSFKSGKSSNKDSKAENENYSLYWKRKAYEYLENNFKLSEQVNQLKRQLGKYEVIIPLEASITNSEMTFSQTESEYRIQKSVPIHIVELQQKRYIQQITQLQISNRLKDSVIQNLQNKIIELTQQIKGENQKSELLEKMRRQIMELQQKNRKLSREQQHSAKLNKIYETQKALEEAKEKSKPPMQITLLQHGQYKFEKELQKNRYRSLS